ncbi:DNA internalization-related competence protein ComEC/Rec2 [Streptococcus halichoeri]|uniref:DNA internalization-related competence protein ComEC/Rec2 n=1 Tax=Streptococcus halichoeri TaxID=254785 RepID=UPI001F1B2C2D|nr:DNA internalization-related competence protein ComEC/Rec2 [Streptococcus halichoeri]
MRLRLIKAYCIKPVHLALLVLLLYFTFHTFFQAFEGYWLIIWGLVFLQLARQYCWQKLLFTGGCLLIFSCWFFWQFSKAQIEPSARNVDLVQVTLIPDSITIDGDLMTGVVHSKGQAYRLSYRLQSQKEQRFYQKLTSIVQLQGDFIVEQPSGRRNPKGFDYQAYLRHQQLKGLLAPKHLRVTAMCQPKRLTEYLAVWRRKAIVYAQTSFPKPLSHYMTGLLFGYLDKDFSEMADLYSQLGIIHLFALSGMQVGFFMRAFRKVMLGLQLPLEIIPYCELIFSVMYAGMTGYSISVLRSLIQNSLSQFRMRGLDNLALTFLIMFFLQPFFLATIGGQLSFGYTFMLMVMTFDELSGKKRAVFQCLAVSLAVIPIILFHFSTFNPLAIPLTFIFGLFFDLFLLPYLCLAFCCTQVLAKLLNPINHTINAVLHQLERGIHLLAECLFTQMTFGSPCVWLLVLLLLMIAVAYDFRKKTSRLVASLTIVLALFWGMGQAVYNEITIVDVGQGDSILLRDMYQKTILIDVGGYPSPPKEAAWRKRHTKANAERTLIPYLKSKGIRTIDQLIITHADFDHRGDLPWVHQHFKIKEVLVSPGSLSNRQFAQQLRKFKLKVKILKVGDKIPIMGSHLVTLYPFQAGDGKNNDSLVLYGHLLNQRFLFTGDIEEEAEAALQEHYPSLKVDILKAPHHGSKGSSTEAFLKQIQAKTVLISAGQNNHFKHPHPQTLERYKKQKMTVYRTDKDGAILLKGWRNWHISTTRKMHKDD